MPAWPKRSVLGVALELLALLLPVPAIWPDGAGDAAERVGGHTSPVVAAFSMSLEGLLRLTILLIQMKAPY